VGLYPRACCYIDPCEWLCCVSSVVTVGLAAGQTRPRARDLGIVAGILSHRTFERNNRRTGVLVGHTTLIRAIRSEQCHGGLAARGNLFRDKSRPQCSSATDSGSWRARTQVNELGEIETPILLTSTLDVPRAPTR